MPNLINNPGNVNNGLAQNYRRTHVGTSRFGTRQLQLYEIHIYGLSDAVAYDGAVYNDSREIILDDTDDWDQPPVVELKSGSIVEAILRGVQEMAEIAIVGQPDYYNNDTDDNDLIITIGVSADTVMSGWEQYIDGYVNNDINYNSNAQDFYDVIGASVEQWAIDNNEYWAELDVYPAYLQGSATDTFGPFALAKTDPAVQTARTARQALSAAVRQSRNNTARPRYTSKRSR